MPAAYGKDLCEKVIIKYFGLYQSVQTVAEDLIVSQSFVYDVIARWESQDADPFNAAGKTGTKTSARALTPAVQGVLVTLLNRLETAYLDELQDQLRRQTGISVSLAALCRGIKEAGYTKKTLHKRAVEASEDLRRAHILRCQNFFRSEQLLFINESAVDARSTNRRQGWSLKGTCTQTKGIFIRGQRYSTLPVMSCDGLLDWMTIEGAASAAHMCASADICLVPQLGPYPGPRSVVVMDNCAVHRGQEFLDKIRAVGAIPVFLPPYSPDQNPIEKVFSKMKAFLQHEQEAASEASAFEMIHDALSSVSASDCKGYFASSGPHYIL